MFKLTCFWTELRFRMSKIEFLRWQIHTKSYSDLDFRMYGRRNSDKRTVTKMLRYNKIQAKRVDKRLCSYRNIMKAKTHRN